MRPPQKKLARNVTVWAGFFAGSYALAGLVAYGLYRFARLVLSLAP